MSNSSVTLHLWSEFGPLRIESDADDGTLWIRAEDASVSLNLSEADRAALRAALDATELEAA